MSESEGAPPMAETVRPAAPAAPGPAPAAKAPPPAPAAPAATSTTPVTVELAAAEVSIPDSVVAPLIGAGANVYIMTNELTQTMREKLGISWPIVQDTLNSRCAKLVAGGLLSSLAAIILYKILKRLSQGKPPGSADVQWGTKTYEMTSLGENGAMIRPEGDAGAIHMLPHKIQLRIAETPQKSISHSADPEALLCKARDGPATTRNRHTRRREPGEPPRGDPPPPDIPWHSEHQHRRSSPRPEEEEEHEDQGGEPECRCPSERCSMLPEDQTRAQPLKPRLLYSVRESRVVQRGMDMADPRLVNMLTYSSCPAALCHYPGLIMGTASTPAGLCYLGSPQIASCAGAGAGVYTPETLAHASCPMHAAQAAAFLLHQKSSPANLAQTPHSCGSPFYPGGVTESPRAVSGGGGITEGVRGECGNRDEGHDQATAVGASAAELHNVQNHQRVPTRTAANSNSPNASCYTTSSATPILRSDNNTPATHLHSAGSCPAVYTYPSHLHPHQPQGMVFHTTPQGAMMYSPAAYSNQHQHTQFQNIPYHHHHHHPADTDDQTHQAIPSQPQKQTARAQQQQQPQQQPVVQQPSDSNISQVSSMVCSESQDGRLHSESGLSTINGQATTPLDVVPREMLPVLRQQEPVTQSARNPVYNSPLPVAHHAPLAIADYAHNEFPWRGPSAHQGYLPSPVYMFGVHPDGYHFHHHHRNPSLQPSWLAGPKGFLTPVSAAHQGMMFASPPASAGLYASSSPAGLYPPSHAGFFAPTSFPHHHHGDFLPPYNAASPTFPGHAMLGSQHFHNPYFYPQVPVSSGIVKPSSMGFHPNFNLSNSNLHVFQRKTGGGEGLYSEASSAADFASSGNSNKIRVVESSHNISISTDNNNHDIAVVAESGNKMAVESKETAMAAMENGSTMLESGALSTTSESSPETSQPILPKEDLVPVNQNDTSALLFALHQLPVAPKDDNPMFRLPVSEVLNPKQQPIVDMPQFEVFEASAELNNDIVDFPVLSDAASATTDHTELFQIPYGSNASKNNDVFLDSIGEATVEIIDIIDKSTNDSGSHHAIHQENDGMETQL